MGDAWPFSAKRHTFGVLWHARILSARFWQNKVVYDKICKIVARRSMVNVKFIERHTGKPFKRWISLKVAWLMHEHLLTQK